MIAPSLSLDCRALSASSTCIFAEPVVELDATFRCIDEIDLCVKVTESLRVYF